MARRLEVQIVGDTRSLERAFRRVEGESRGFSRRLGGAFVSITKGAAFAAGAAGVGALFAVLHEGTKELKEQQRVAAQTAAVLKSTGSAANVTAKQVDALALSLSNLSGVDDEAIKGMENMLLTFRGIRNEAGKGNDIFTQTAKVVLDMSSAFQAAGKNINLAQVAIQVGKALNDPIKGLTSLRRVGVQFSEAQTKIIKRLVETGRLMEAQKLILGELRTEFGGSAKAAGSTLAGQLSILRERFKDLSGELLGAFVPSFASALKSLTGFVKRLSEAKGFRAKVAIVLEAGRDIGAQALRLASQVRDQVAAALARTDWRQVGREVGDAIAKGFTAVAAFLSRVDWGNVGRVIVRGIGNFLRGVDWKAVAIASIRLLIAAFKAQAELLLGIGEELGGALVRGIGTGLTKAKNFVIRELLALVNRILGVTGFLGRFDPFKGVREKVQAQLKRMEGDARASSGKIQGSLDSIKGKNVSVKVKGEGTDRVQREIDGIKGKTITVTVKTDFRSPDTREVVRNIGGGGALPPTQGMPAVDTGRVAREAQQAAQAAKAAATKQAAAAKAAALARKKAAETVAKAAAAAKAAADKATQAFNDLMDAFSLKLDRARITKSFADDLRVLAQTEAAIKKRIAAEGKTTELERRLFEIQQEREDIRKQQADALKTRQQAKQFRAIGLTAEGEEPIPGVKNLRKRLGSITESIKGTFLDTSKTRGLLAAIRRVLSGGLGKVSADVRAKIKQMLDDINSQLKDNQGKQKQITKGGVVNADAIIQNLGLSPEQARALKQRLSKVTTGGGTGRVGGRSAAPAAQVPMTVLGQGGMTINGPITVVAQDPDQFLRQLQRKARRRATQTTGPHAGNATGTTR